MDVLENLIMDISSIRSMYTEFISKPLISPIHCSFRTTWPLYGHRLQNNVLFQLSNILWRSLW